MSELRIENQKGQQLFARYWNEDNNADKSCKGLVFIVHGYCEHCLYYTEIAELLIKQGFYVFSHDHVGHGQSDGDRVHVLSFDDYVEDVFLHVDKVQKKFPDKPIFLIGHSMGGAVAILAAMERPKYFSGVILIGPLIIPNRQTATPCRIYMGQMLARLFPQLHIAKLDPKTTSRDEESATSYANDPLVYHSGVKCRWAVAMLDALKRIENGLSDIDWPFFVLHGGADAMCELDGSKKLYEQAKSADKKIKLFDDAFHQLHRELEPVKRETFDLIAEWLNERA